MLIRRFTTPLPTGVIDLRSDTVTFPLAEMMEEMARAPLGDDVYGNDPTVNRLQELAAEMTGMEAGLFVASGTMGNLVALLAHCGRGSEVIAGGKSHIFWDEAGGAAALGGMQIFTVPNQPDGTLSLEDIAAAIRPDDIHAPHTRVVALENTMNYLGGQALTPEYTRQVADLAHSRGLKLHIDGARLFNAATALGVPAKTLSGPADSVMFCLSKGLCAPVGSVLCGSRVFINEARRMRKQVGGGMRQAGVLAAAGIVGLQVVTGLLGEDHRRAKLLAGGLAHAPGIRLQYGLPQTNMVYIELKPEVSLSPQQIVEWMLPRGISLMESGPRHFRLVTHYWVSDEDVQKVVAAFCEMMREK